MTSFFLLRPWRPLNDAKNDRIRGVGTRIDGDGVLGDGSGNFGCGGGESGVIGRSGICNTLGRLENQSIGTRVSITGATN